MDTQLDYHEIKYRLENNAVFKILRKPSAAFMLGFFFEQFKKRHRADIGQAELVGELSAYSEFVRMADGDDEPRREPSAYLDEWANDGFLRKYYPSDSIEACYDLTPDSERALEWIGELARRSFIGTESRLLSLLDALKDLAFGASFDKDERKTELERQKAEIEAELARLERGETETLDSTKILERYYGVEDAARRLLADFKQIEQNFRDLDRETKERVIASEHSRGAVLKEVFEHRDAIVSSDQGKSFNAFWGFLMSMKTREEMAELIERVLALEPVRDMSKAFPLDTLDNRLVSAGARVQRMTHRLNEELRFFLDERSRRESKRVGELIESFKRLALLVRETPPDSRRFIIIDGDPEPSLVMDRPLYEPEDPVFIAKSPMHTGIPSVEADALFDLDSIDMGLIGKHIRLMLLEQPQASLSDIVNRNPIRMGAAEVLGYLSIASEPGAASDSGKRTEIQAYNERRRTRFVVDSPDIIYLSELPR
jgi:hypothetical protein